MIKSMLACSLIPLLTALAAPVMAAAPNDKPVLAAMDAWKQAMIKKDRAAFEKVLHPDLAYGHSSGAVETKAQAIDHIVKGKGVLEDIDLVDTNVRINGNVAVVTGKAVYHQLEDGKKSLSNLSVLSVWLKGAQGWQMLARQATKPPAEGAHTAATPAATPPGKTPASATTTKPN